MTAFKKSISILFHYPLATLLALPGYILLMMVLLPGFAVLSQLVIRIALFVLFILIDSLLLQPALSMHLNNILQGEPEKQFLREAVQKSRLKLPAMLLLIASILIALYIAYLLLLGIVAVVSSYNTLVIVLSILKYIVLPVPCILIGGLYFTYLSLLMRSEMSIAQTLAESFRAFGRIAKRAIPALAAACAIAFSAFWIVQIAYYIANGISLLHIIDNPLRQNYAGILIMLALMPLYSWLICYFRCLLNAAEK